MFNIWPFFVFISYVTNNKSKHERPKYISNEDMIFEVQGAYIIIIERQRNDKMLK
jgi:hypothetical protein